MDNDISEECGTSGRTEMHRGFWWRNLKERDHLKALGVDGRIILKGTLKKLYIRAWIGSIWLTIGTRDGPLVICLRVSKKAGNFLTS
jgi:hypothetical protein